MIHVKTTLEPRWQHPQRGLLYPDAFIGLAEETGLVNSLTEIAVGLAILKSSSGRLKD